ncbi:Cna protein B-type domain protein [Candidatus Sulfotelmatobacter kueseliae]|uniref:Cna protein B-type domain protein n=1 Tax=Candidatus Sulfotelmatobacter kueseliae TaxID=2042962 RepID=A0A2U3KUX0_9BACT|nr:Cna protein B-type domain protein [Candidatus Sulfotelmatobacter kueseliae]
MPASYILRLAVLAATLFSLAANSFGGQSLGNSTALYGTVLDATGAVVVGATVKIHNPVSGLDRSAQTNTTGGFVFQNVPFNPYHLTITAKGFAPYVQDVELRSIVPVTLSITLQAVVAATTVTVHEEAGDLVETDSTDHSDVDRSKLDRLPMPTESAGLSYAVTALTPGVSADSNNQMHGLGDHAENTIAVDDQSNSDQSSKTFSNQIPSSSIQAMEVIEGAPPAEFGGKTSLVVKVSTRSGQGVTTPTGSLTTSYGSFGTANASFDLAYGGQNWGNFVAIDGTDGGRFLDAPEFAVMHDKGNVENFFDRVDYQVAGGNTLHLDLAWTRSWFQTPQTYDNLNLGGLDPLGNPVPAMDQRSQIKTFNIAPAWTRLLSPTKVFTIGAIVRQDDYHYYPSADPFADLGPANLQSETIGQHRTLTNAGLRSDFSYVRGIHNMKMGVNYQHTFLDENDSLGIVDPTLLPSLVGANGIPCYNTTTQQAIAAPCTTLLPYDLTRGGGLYPFNGHTDVKELALYAQDTISAGNWNFSLGLRGDFYNGLSSARQLEPRLGIAYNIKPSSTVLRISYARTLETPFNENLVLSNNGCDFAVIAALVPCIPAALNPGFRNEFHAGVQQAFGRYLVFDGEYIWKYTHNGYDFSVLGNTPITFPIEWHNSKIPGLAASVRMPNLHGLSASVVFSSVAARFFPPQAGGLGVTVGQNGLPFRIDHDETFNQSSHLQYQLGKRGPWFGFSWRYDSGQVAGATPCYGVNPGNDCPASTMLNGQPAVKMIGNGGPLTADQQFEAGFYCGSVRATPTVALPSVCLASQFGSSLIRVPAPGTENDDHNPPRIAPRHLFDASIGHDNLFHGDKYKISLQLTAINFTNNYVLYNFLSTFSGTHYVSPRSLTAEIGFHF